MAGGRRYDPAPWRAIRWPCACAPSRRPAGGRGRSSRVRRPRSGATVLALVHQQLDLGTYLLGGAHAQSNDLFTVTYPADHLGFTYPPFSALLFAPFAHVPLRVCEVLFSWVNLASLFALIAVSLRAVCAALDRRTVVWWALALVLPVLLFDPVRQTFLLGQVNIILALMVVADMTLDLPAAPGDPGRVGRCHQGDADHPRPLPAPDQAGSLRSPGRRLLLRRRAPGRRAQRLHVVGLLDARHPRPATCRHALVDRQPGPARSARADARPRRDDDDHRSRSW